MSHKVAQHAVSGTQGVSGCDSFKRASDPRARHRALSAQIPEGLKIKRSFLSWVEHWDRLFRMPPHVFYQTLCRDLPGDVRVHIDFDLGGGGDFNVSIKERGRYVFEAENKLVEEAGGMNLKFDSWENSGARGQGRGVTLFGNILQAIRLGEIQKIVLRAGKEDGRHFWARHGFYYRAPADQQRMAAVIQDNLQEYAPRMAPESLRQVQEILAQDGLDVCYQLGRLDETVPVGDQVRPLAWALLRGDVECHYCLDLHDAAQMARVAASLRRPGLPRPQLML